MVKDGHRTPEPEQSTIDRGVQRESVCIASTRAALNDLPMCACVIQNSYLQAPSSEKYNAFCSPEFRLENVGKCAMIVRALCGGKSAGADYWRHVRSIIEKTVVSSCKADPDAWLRPALESNGVKYYQCVLL